FEASTSREPVLCKLCFLWGSEHSSPSASHVRSPVLTYESGNSLHAGKISDRTALHCMPVEQIWGCCMVGLLWSEVV
ncbi:hypothetical protein COCMIDRAFT_90619, partial [Bipolaris oryzae ATCC 44560]